MITESDLYAICMESDTADKRVKELYEAFGFALPQYFEPRTAKRDAIPDPFSKGTPAPVTLAQH